MQQLTLITGATSGIGRALAERLLAEGHDLIATGRDQERLDALKAAHPQRRVTTLAADLSTDSGMEAVASVCASEPLTMLVNNAGVAHYQPFDTLPRHDLREVLQVKVMASSLLAHATLPGMKARGQGAVVNVAGMIAFSGPGPSSMMPRRAVYGGALSYLLTLTQLLNAELEGSGVRAHVVCPGVVATEFHTRQGLDLSAVARMSAEDVVTATLRGVALGEVVIAPGVEDAGLLQAAFRADLAAFGAQQPTLASRYLR